MDFRILGPLEVLADEAPVALGGVRQKGLLALLLLRANEPVAIDRLIGELWGEHPPAGAVKAVQVQISRLRRALGRSAGPAAGVVVTHDGGYELRAEPETIDSRRFERLFREGSYELGAGRPGLAVVAFEAALSLWRGPPFADLAYEPCLQVEIARLCELRVAVLEELIGAKLALGRQAEVLGVLESLIVEHPYRERLRGQLMLALYRSDRQAEALQAYQDTRRALVEELGIEPGERLRELERGILSQDPALAIGEAGAAPTPRARVPRAAFVGRERELAELVAGLEDAVAGNGRLFLLIGEPGIGKTRLAEELIGRAVARGARVLLGRCWEAGGAPAFWPWVQALRAYVREIDADALRAQLGGGASDLAQILPELRSRFRDLPEPQALDAEGGRFRLFDAAAQFLREASARTPLVLVVDDLHAADASSLLLLRFLAREIGSSRILLLAVYRDVDPLPGQPLAEMQAEVSRESLTRRLTLEGLSARQVAEYVELTASEIASVELAAAVHEETEGNPLFVGEMVRLLSIEGVRDESTALHVSLPDSVREVIGRRLRYLQPECNRVLELASVLGREFSLEVLAGLARVSQDLLQDTLDDAMSARVLADVPGAAGRVRFAHVLIRDTIYDGLTAARRVRLHKRVVEVLETVYGEQPGAHLAELAHHAIAGGERDKGWRYARRAGHRALALLAYEEAARLYTTALEALELACDADEKQRCELLLSLGEAEARAGRTAAAQAASLRAAGIARQLGLSRELARAAAVYGGRTAWVRAASDRRLVPLLEEGLGAIGDDDVELRVRLLARLAGALRDEPSRDRRDALGSEAIELARRSGSLAALAYALDGRAQALLGPDTIAQCLTLGTELRDLAQRIGDSERLVHAHMDRFAAQVLTGDIRGAERDLDAMRDIAEEIRQPAQLWEVYAARTMLALGAGRLSEADELLPKGLALGAGVQPEMAIPSHRTHWYTLCEFRGTLADVEPAIRALAADYPARPVFRCLIAHLDAILGRLPQAQRALHELAHDEFSVLPFDMEWLYGITLLAETAARLSEARAARSLYRILGPWAALNAVDHPEGMRGSVSRYLGLLAATLGQTDAATVHYEEAIASNAMMGLRPWLAHTQRDYARLLLTRHDPGDEQRADQLLAAARATYRQLGISSQPA